MKKVKQSFTLIEILVVIVIIGILSSFIFFTINDSVEKAQIAKSKMFAESIRNNLLLNLVSEWKFDEISGTTASDSWGSNNGTLDNFNFDTTDGWQSKSECISGQCLKFDGIDDYVNCENNNSLNITGDITISTWVKADSVSVNPYGTNTMHTILSKWNTVENQRSYAFGLGYKYEGGITFVTSSTGTNYDTRSWNYSLIADNYYHIVATKTGTTVHIYVNGVDIGNYDQAIGDTLSSIYTSTSKVNIGKTELYAGNSNFFNGSIDDVRIYNATISGTQIKQNYLAGLNNLYAKGMISTIEYNERISQNK